MKPALLREFAVGAACALLVPVKLHGSALSRLMAPGLVGPARGRDPAPALRAADLSLRQLARLPRSLWRNTCLYRSVAECLVLRYHGIPAVVRIGVRKDRLQSGAIAAHAWVIPSDDPPSSEASPPGYQPLEHGIGKR